MAKELTIIILTYNSSHIIKNCLESFDCKKYDVVIVDNASSDNTIAFVTRSFPQVKIISNKVNAGFGRGNNVALRDIKTKYSLILNPDALISDQDIEKVINQLDNNPKAAIAGPVVLENCIRDQSEIGQKLQDIQKDLLGTKDNFRKKLSKTCYEVRFIIGCAMFLKMDLMKKVGFFDENFFMFYEDDEICKRVNDFGFFNIIISDAFAYHAGGKSSKNTANFWSVYKKSWHINAWSKFYWKKVRKGWFRAKRSSFKFCFKYLILSLHSLVFFNKDNLANNLGALSGSFAYFVGLKAFKKNGQPRG